MANGSGSGKTGSIRGSGLSERGFPLVVKSFVPVVQRESNAALNAEDRVRIPTGTSPKGESTDLVLGLD